jgi:hypothetical protein
LKEKENKNKKSKVFHKINFIDFCVIIIVLVIAAGAYYKFGVLNKTGGTTELQPVTYTVEIKRVREYALQNVREGDELYDKTSGNSIGKIVKVESEQATEPVLCNDGIYRTGTVQNRINLIITVIGEGTVTERGCFINKTYELVRESDRRFMTKYFEAEGRIKDFLV